MERLAHGPCLFKSEVTRTNDSHKSFTFEFIYFYKFYSALDSEYEPPSDVLAHTVDNLWIKVYGPKSVCVCETDLLLWVQGRCWVAHMQLCRAPDSGKMNSRSVFGTGGTRYGDHYHLASVSKGYDFGGGEKKKRDKLAKHK